MSFPWTITDFSLPEEVEVIPRFGTCGSSRFTWAPLSPDGASAMPPQLSQLW